MNGTQYKSLGGENEKLTVPPYCNNRLMKYPLHRAADGRWVHDWVRQSSVKTADMCLERFRNDIWGIVSEEIKDASTLGTACHAVAEDALNTRLNGGEMTEQDMLDSFEYYWDEALPTIEKWYSYSPESAYVSGIAKIKSWREQVLPELKPVAVEKNFNLPLYEDDQRIITFSGTIDLVEEDRCWDWKFPGRDYSRNKWEYERWDVQSIAYSLATGIPDFSYAIMHPKGVGRMDLTRGEEHYEWFRQKVLALAKLVESQIGNYPLGDNGWWCSEKWCPNWARCKGATTGGIN